MAKLTREQVSQLSDVELNRGMAWLYGESISDNFPELEFVEDNGKVLEMDLVYGYWEINYLTNYNLTMPLAIEHEVQLLTGQGQSCWHIAKKQYYDYDGPISSISVGTNLPLRAICEVLLMIAMERDE